MAVCGIRPLLYGVRLHPRKQIRPQPTRARRMLFCCKTRPWWLMWRASCGQTFSPLEAETVRRQSLAMPRRLSARPCWTSTVPGREDRPSLTLLGTYGGLCSWPNRVASYPNLRTLKRNADATSPPSPLRYGRQRPRWRAMFRRSCSRRRKKKVERAWQSCEQRWRSEGHEHERFAAKQADPRNVLASWPRSGGTAFFWGGPASPNNHIQQRRSA